MKQFENHLSKMQTHPKISRLIPHTITLSSPYNHRDFLRKSPRLPLNLYLNSLLEDQPGQSDPKMKEQRDLLRIFRGLKCIKKIHQNEFSLHRARLSAPKTIYIIKQTQRVKVLDIHDRLSGDTIGPTRLDLWLRYAKHLQNVSHRFNTKTIAGRQSNLRAERVIQRSLEFIPWHRKLTAFKVKPPHVSAKPVESLLQFQRYPQSLKNFAIDYINAAAFEKLDNDRMASAFSRLVNLESLTLIGRNTLNVAEILLEKVPSLLKIRELNVQRGRGGLFKGGSQFDLNKCQSLQNLQYLKIAHIDEDCDFSKLTNPPQLKSISITAGIGIKGLELISEFISLFNKSLKSLKIEIQHVYVAETEERIKTLFGKIRQLVMLTSFKLQVNERFPYLGKTGVSLSPEILNSLKGLFLKPVKLESFEWQVPRISGPGIFFELLQLLEKSRPTLKKLKIFHPLMNLGKPHEAWLVNFLQKLEKIEVLCLTGFLIQDGGFGMDLVDYLKEMKMLKSLGIGSYDCRYFGVGSNASLSDGGWFAKPLERILKKRGLEVLKIETESSFNDKVQGIKEPLDLKEIMKANPALKEVSKNVREFLKLAA